MLGAVEESLAASALTGPVPPDLVACSHSCGFETSHGPCELRLTCPETNPVIIVDDDSMCRRLMQHLLVKAGYGTFQVEDGRSLFELLETTFPALILLDLDMPGMSGMEVCRRLKSDARYDRVPVIFLTGTTSPAVKVEAFGAGCADYVTKPIESVELLARIRCHLELASSRCAAEARARSFEYIAAEQSGRLEQVRRGQVSLLTDPSAFQNLKLAIQFIPAHEAGGDFYEVTALSQDQVGLLVTDVAGHDLRVPFLTGALKGLTSLCMSEGLSVRETLIMLNTGLHKMLEPGQYVTGCYAKFDRECMTIEVGSAGHPPALLLRTDGSIVMTGGTGDVLGVFDNVVFEPQQLEVSSGDRLFLYTDGLVEGFVDAQGRRGRGMFGTRMLQELVLDLKSQPVTQVVNAIVRDLRGQNPQGLPDDVVLLGIEL